MSFMHILPLGFMALITGVISLFCLIGLLIEGEKFKNWISATFIFIFANLLIWLVCACSEPFRVEKVDVINIQTMNSPSGPIQVIWYSHPRKGSIMLNLNKHFGCQFNQGTKIKHTRFATGPYSGVSFDLPEGNFDKFEIIEAEK